MVDRKPTIPEQLRDLMVKISEEEGIAITQVSIEWITNRTVDVYLPTRFVSDIQFVGEMNHDR